MYSGSENPLLLSRFYNIEFLCDYQMHWYPFDTQTCYMEFRLEADMQTFVNLVPGSQQYQGPEELTQYFVKSSSIRSIAKGGGKGVRVSITLGRRLLGVFLTIYFPTVLLNLIGHCTNYFKDFFFEAVVTVNLTCMLVLVTMFINTANNLPKTSYIKMMDIWLIFTLLLPFKEVLLHTYMDYLRNDEDREINHHGMSVKPESNNENDNELILTRVIPSPAKQFKTKDLISRKEDVQVEALKNHYKHLNSKEKKNKKNLEFCQKIAHIYSPICVLCFVSIYWFLGLRHAEFF